ncbi:penicillin-binding protein [Radiobacillus kanasensis]|uniref:penicillin-binding protein n=1 Tax=Radiobacillus kanasensis TaxID=2844358 RepID=UPI001E2F0F43|nr:penicillin-binding protein [Radiobacillus kanasensis]UFU00936.1 penicillin-binding protein [Radiobacillus kanasensis]
MKKNKTTHVMSSILLVVFSVLFLVLCGRFLYIQGTGEVSGVSLGTWADKQRTSTYEIEAKRGTIYDRNGMTLAYDRATYRLQAIVDESYSDNLEEPQHVTDPQQTAEKLAPLLNIEVEEMVKTMNEGIAEGQFQVEFGTKGRDLSQGTKEKIEALKLPGIQFQEESIRYYPNGQFASRVIGLAQKNEDSKISGVTGIELEMDELLSGEKGKVSYQRDKYSTKLLDPKEVMDEPDNGDNVYLTIDQKIQTFLEDAMSQVAEQYKPERMSAIVMDPKTGQVLAMANRPSYNPNDIGDVSNWYNDSISNPFEPGSTMKIFTLASAIAEGVWNPNDVYKSGTYSVQGGSISDWNTGWGTISYLEGIQRSSNVGAAKLAYEKIGPERFLEYLNAFDFDQKANIDLPGEVAGQILYRYSIEKVTTAFGQGTTVTPIQLMKAATSVANDGKMMKPYVISKIVDPNSNKVVQETKPEVVSEPITADTAKKVRDILETVITSENGTGKVYKLNDYTVAGKTGTAQIPGPDGKYLTGEENYVFSFLGMAPKEDPELMMYVSVKQPTLSKNESGSEPVSFIFKNVMENSLHYLNIKPDQEDNGNISTVEVPNLTNQSVASATDQLSKLGFKVSTIGNGQTVTGVYPQAGVTALPNERVLLLTDQPTVPDMKGWSVRDVLKFSSLTGMKVDTMGTGFAIKQSIQKDTPIKSDGYLVVEFAPPSYVKEAEESSPSPETTE